MAAVTAAEIEDAFPYGALVVDEDMENHYNVVGLDPKEFEGKLVVLGWAPPNKDFYYDFSDPTIQDDGWIVNREGGGRCLFRPLSKTDGDQTRADLY